MSRRPFSILAGLILALCGLWFCNEARSQGFTPTADQLEMFRNLPAYRPDDAVLKALADSMSGVPRVGSVITRATASRRWGGTRPLR